MVPRRYRAPAQRGAAVVETALVVGVILMMILGGVQLGIIGYVQMTADAASFLNAHQTVLAGATDADGATTSTFPQIAAGDLNQNPAPAPSASVYIDYGYNDPSAIVRANSANNRHGGASMMQPTQLQASVVKAPGVDPVANILGIPLGVEAGMTEPEWLENGVHFDVANSQNYGNAGSGFQVDYFTDGENTPPYYVGANLQENCPDTQPWPAGQGACVSPVRFRPLGIAEHLDDSNWTLPNGTISTTPVAFQEAACHQRVYAQLAQFFAANSDLTLLEPSPHTAIDAGSNGDYAIWPQPPGQGFGLKGGTAGAQADSEIQQVYQWDAQLVNGGYPPGTYTGVGAYPFPYEGVSGSPPAEVPVTPSVPC